MRNIEDTIKVRDELNWRFEGLRITLKIDKNMSNKQLILIKKYWTEAESFILPLFDLSDI